MAIMVAGIGGFDADMHRRQDLFILPGQGIQLILKVKYLHLGIK
jgi:hypothetical protein